jgi:hypothetical protein
MEIRAYRESDFERIREIHRKQGFDYPMPDLSDPVFAVGCVAEDGVAQVAAFLKIQAEAYLFMDPEYATPRERWKALLQVHEATRRQATDLGLSEVQIWIPPEMAKKTSTGRDSAFVRKLQRLGWGKEPESWTSLSYRIRTIATR